jgi:ABC-type transporter Mla subunit MlaD
MNKDSENVGQYIYQTTYDYRERLVGFFVLFGFLLFLLFIFVSVKNQHLFEKRVKFYIEVNSSDGISQGSIVTALGTEVGQVSGLNLAQNHKIRVTIEVYEEQRKFIRAGATARVNRLTNIGNALIEIESESIDAPMLTAESTIPMEETPSLNDLLLGLANLVQSADNNDLLRKFEDILPKVEETLGNVHEIIAQIASGQGTLGAAVFDKQVEKELKIVVKSGADILTETESIISVARQRLEQIGPVLTDVKHITYDMRGATQSLPDMVKELHESIVQAKTAIILINEELQDIKGVALDAKRTLSKTDRLVDSAQNTWPLSGNSSKSTPRQLIAPHSSYE